MTDESYRNTTLEQYHYALLEVLGDKASVTLHKVMSSLATKYKSEILEARNVDEALTNLTTIIKDKIKISPELSLEHNDGKFALTINNCIYCHANTKFNKDTGERPFCPIPALINNLLKDRKDIKNFQWDSVEKPGEIGFCIQKFLIST